MSRPVGTEDEGLPPPIALVVAGGELPPAHLLPSLSTGEDLVVAADGGLRHAARLGLKPVLLVGDLDSVSEEVLAAFPGLAVERHPPDKDELDLELALEASRRLGARSARVLGAFGGRFDQSLAALLIAARCAMADEPFAVSLHGGPHEGWVAAPGLPVGLSLAAGTTLGLLALTATATVSGVGLLYPVKNLVLPFGTGLGVSNQSAGGRLRVTCEEGAVAVVIEHAVDEQP